MALIKCPECGKEISDFATNCPNCGFPIRIKSNKINENNIQYQSNNMYQPNITHNPNMSAQPIRAYIHEPSSKPNIGIATIIFSVFGIAVIIVIILAAVVGGKSSEENTDMVETNVDSSVDEILPEENEGFTQSEIDISEIEDKSVKTASPEEPPVEIFATDLLNSWSDYIGKWVTVSYACDQCEDDEQSIQSTYDGEAKLYLRSYVDNYRQFEYGDYITITGLVDSQYASYIEIKNAHIDYFGDESQSVYNIGKAEYDERKRIEEEEYEASFKENVESPSYDDLLRYPDSYQEKQIKVKVKIVRVEPDGIIFDGDIEATMSGETVALYDGRTTKEPKLREGDSVTIYGYGKGTTTVKVQDVSGILPKTVDKYDIPAIDIRYIDF